MMKQCIFKIILLFPVFPSCGVQ